MTPFTLPFNAIGSADLALVGGKGANLGELTRAGYNVPPGFCVSTRAFAYFMQKATVDVYPRLDGVSTGDLEQLRRVGHEVRACLEEVPLPAEVADAVVTAWLELGENGAYAVRSSATAEDLPHASFAGQQDTYLNVRGKDALLTSVKACFISLFTDRAILYRVQNGFDHREVALSAVVQRMVQPDVSGILFTADPVSGNRSVVSIDASFGLGEALVSGLVSADLYQVDRRSQEIIKRQIATKGLAIRSVVEGGTEQVELSGDERTQASLSDAQVLELANLGGQIEAHYGVPQDIEWALADGRFYVLQARPITSLYPLPEPRPDDGALHVYFSFSHFQVMTDAMSPLVRSLWRILFPVGHADGQLESRHMLAAGGRLCIDPSPFLRHPLGRRALPRLLKNADQLAAGAFAELARRPSFLAHGERFKPLRVIPVVGPYVFRTVRSLLWAKPEGVTAAASELMDRHIAAAQARLRAATDMQAKLEVAVDEMRHIFAPIFTWAPQMVSGMLAAALLNALMKGRTDPDDLAALGRGLTGNVTTEMNLRVGDLADAARASTLAAHLSRTDINAKVRLADAAKLPGGEAFLRAWNDFMSAYGARGPAEIDLRRPRWLEDPASLLQMVVNMLRNEPGAHRRHYRKLMMENERAAERVIKAAHEGFWGWLRGPLVRRLVRVSRNLSPLREHQKLLAIRLLALVKPVLLEAGEQLKADGGLELTDDIWFLSVPEVLEALRNPKKEWREGVAERRRAFEHYQDLTPPRVMTSEGEIPALRLEGKGAPEGALLGTPVSAGVVEGVAKVVLDPSTEALEPGEILIAPFTDPGWTPLFVNAAGLVTEVGGLMTHGSLVAREYGIPAVVGVQDATERIKTGQRVRVHGDAGYVELLDANEAELASP